MRVSQQLKANNRVNIDGNGISYDQVLFLAQSVLLRMQEWRKRSGLPIDVVIHEAMEKIHDMM